MLGNWMGERFFWGDVTTELRRVLLVSEEEQRKKLSAQKPNVEVGIWIEQMITDPSLGNSSGAPVMPNLPSPGFVQRGPRRSPSMVTQAAPDASAAPSGSTIQLVCRAVNLSAVDPGANDAIAFEVQKQFQSSPMFDPKTTALAGTITPDEATGTFTFGITVALQNPLKL